LAKITLDSVISGFKSVTRLVSNFSKIEDSLNNDVLWRDNPEGEPNQMEDDLDMNTNRITNLPSPVNDTDAVRWVDVKDGVSGVNEVVPSQSGNAKVALTTNGTSLVFGAVDSDNVDFLQAGTGAVSTDVQSKLRETVSVKDFGAVGDGVTDDTAAIEAAWAASNSISFPAGTYYAPALEIDGGGGYDAKVIEGNGATITGDDVFIYNLFQTSITNLKITASGSIYLEGIRYNSFKNVYFDGNVKIGRFNETLGLSSWSMYWSDFRQCRFSSGVTSKTSITNANLNSVTFDTCEFRKGAQTSMWEFDDTVDTDPTFSGITFTGCDFSYAPVFDLQVDFTTFFAATIVGGYLDSGSTWYNTGSFKASALNIIGVRNPGSVPVDSEVTADLRITTGGGKTQTSLPVSAVSYFDVTTKKTTIDSFFRTSTSKPLPHDGVYSVSFHLTPIAGAVVSISVENITAGGGAEILNLVQSGYGSYTFEASAGDVIEFVTDGDGSANITIDFLYLTAGAAIYEAVEYDVIANAAQLQSSIENNAAATTLGSVAKKIEVFDAAGSSLGFIPLYDSIT